MTIDNSLDSIIKSMKFSFGNFSFEDIQTVYCGHESLKDLFKN